MNIEPKDIQVGDRVTISGTAVTVYGDGGVALLFCDNKEIPKAFNPSELAQAEITRPEKPLAVGDLVRTRTGATGVIADLHRDIAWIEPEPGKVWPLTPDDKDAQPVRVSQLTRIEETADEQVEAVKEAGRD